MLKSFAIFCPKTKKNISRTQEKFSRGLMLEPWRPMDNGQSLHGPLDRQSYNVNPGLINPKRLFNWECTI